MLPDPSATSAALPAQALSQDLLPHPAPLTFHLLTCAAPGGGNGVGAQGLRCLNRYPSVLPGLAMAKTRTHHRDGTGCWGREMNKAGSGGGEGRKKTGKEKKRRREKVGWGQSKGEMGGWRGAESKEREKAKQRRKSCRWQGGIPETRKKKGRRHPIQPSPSAAPCPVAQGTDGKQRLLRPEGTCCRPGLGLVPGSRSQLGVGSEAAVGAGDLPQKG